MAAFLTARLAELAGADLTYAETRATRGPMPSGYRHMHRKALLGTGDQAFGLAANGPRRRPGGTPIDPRSCTRVGQLGVRPGRVAADPFHDLRYGYVSVLLSLGMPRTVMEIVGHSAMETTMLAYGHVSLKDTRAALDQLGDLLDEDGGLRGPVAVIWCSQGRS